VKPALFFQESGHKGESQGDERLLVSGCGRKGGGVANAALLGVLGVLRVGGLRVLVPGLVPRVAGGPGHGPGESEGPAHGQGYDLRVNHGYRRVRFGKTGESLPNEFDAPLRGRRGAMT